MVDVDMPLTLWAACVGQYGILERAEAVRAGGFTGMSVFTGELARHEQQGGSLAGLRRELAAREAPITCIDPYFPWYPGFDPALALPEVAIHFQHTEDDVLRYAEELGVRYLSVLGPFFHDGIDAPFHAQVEALGAFADRAAAIGLRPHLEIVPTTKIPDLAAGLALVRAVGRPNLGLLLDTYNLCRGGLDPAELDDVPAAWIFQMQLNDAPAVPRGASFWEEATSLRELPGDGELPLVDMLGRIARKGPLPPLGPEVHRAAFAGVPAAEIGRVTAAATRRLLADVAAAAA
jgi:sugar phosphate isomerase/epimerase